MSALRSDTGDRGADDGCEVWTAAPQLASDPHMAKRFLAILSTDERARMDRFYFERDRRAYLVAHALARLALSACAPETAPADWRFAADARGRPEIAATRNPRRLRFNLSHTDGLVACVVTREIDCGIDVELAERNSDLAALCQSVLTPAEHAVVSALTPARQAEGFFRYWTLKEAYAKALGLGILLPFRECGFELGGEAVRLTAAAGNDDAEWQFEQWPAGECHILALALRRGGTPRRRVVWHKELPCGFGVGILDRIDAGCDG